METTKYTKTILEVIRECGIPANILGHDYLYAAMELTLKDPMYKRCITKMLYPTIAQEYNTTPSRVERSIRHATEVCFTRSDPEVVAKIFGNTINLKSGKLSNAEMIYTLDEYVKMKCGEFDVK